MNLWAAGTSVWEVVTLWVELKPYQSEVGVGELNIMVLVLEVADGVTGGVTGGVLTTHLGASFGRKRFSSPSRMPWYRPISCCSRCLLLSNIS